MSEPLHDTPPATHTQFLPESEWEDLLLAIHVGNVVPIVGPGMVTVPGADGQPVPLIRWLAPRLAERLGLKDASTYTAD
jgi:hypothetical protein